MTRADHPVTRRTYSSYRGRDLVVTLHSRFLEYRQFGTRKRYRLDHLSAFQYAAKLEADRVRAERAGSILRRGSV